MCTFPQVFCSHMFHATKLQIYLYYCTDTIHNCCRKGDTYLLQALTGLTVETDPMAKKCAFINTTLLKLPPHVFVWAHAALAMGGTNACTHTHGRARS